MKNKETVHVVGLTGKPMAPTTPELAERLLGEKLAVVYCDEPYTIQLLHKTGGVALDPALPFEKAVKAQARREKMSDAEIAQWLNQL